ncbi:hypothetical protein F443_19461 [Phytophthora nicotianae P1569]|uniref:EF-hand domain-containing protein n=1 Tax=Phytophthora nicotianae P1569 TaxID=1317065 RepID=V9E4D4_PHYNI|nr:hypothetical protein F443_19461 [Phytophthora nicotianae P1569]
MFTIWKKLFYLLDENGNGYIDRKEFTNVFVDHLDDLLETSDGQKLMQLLFGVDNNQYSSISPTQEQIAAVFSVMDTNRDNEIEWSEYLRFLQQRQQQLFTTEGDDETPATDVLEVKPEQKQELRKKNREDTRTSSSNPANESDQDEIPPEETRDKPRSKPSKQEPAASKRPVKVSSSEEKLLKLQYSNQEQNRLQQQITSLETILAIERRRYAELAADRQALMRSYQQLHLKHQSEIIQEQTKTKWMKQTIERQQQQLEEREKLRQNHNQASIVLQSTFRSRLEQKRYQGIKLQRVNAAITIQCTVRRVKAMKQLRVLQEMNRVAKERIRAASLMQKFILYQLYRKERALLVEARKISAMILQKNARRMIACTAWKGQKLAVLRLQCWVRQRLAMKRFTRLHDATLVVKKAVVGWYPRWKYAMIKASTRKIQKWWRRASRERSAYFTLVEAALCIQSVWKRRSARKWFEREWKRQEKYLAHLEAAICIQAAWRRQQQHTVRKRAKEGIPWLDDDTTVEALLYNLVAMVEADVVIPVTIEHITEDTPADDQTVPSPAEKLDTDAEELICGKEDPIGPTELEYISSVGDGGDGGNADEIEAVLDDLVAVVIRDNEDTGGVRRESDLLTACNDNLAQVEWIQEDEAGDQSCPGTTFADQKVILSKSESDEVDVTAKLLDDPEYCTNQSLIDDMKELVVLSAVAEEATHMQQVSDSTLDEIVEKAAEFEPSENAVEPFGAPDNVMQAVVSSEITRDDTSATMDQSQRPFPEDFDVDVATGDFTVPEDSDDEASNRHDCEDGSSIDSTDLMMEADAMTTIQDIPDNTVPKSARHTPKATRMDSSILLADLDQLNAREDTSTPEAN